MMKAGEGHPNLGGFQTDDQTGVVGNIWNFSVWDKDIYSQLQQYEGKHVKLFYQQKYKAMPWQGDTKYYIEKVEEIKRYFRASSQHIIEKLPDVYERPAIFVFATNGLA
ncbi:MAG: hypothetical protein DHS20C18_21230 [Saprospiraceae bacterium]|nr:MAG: hypothetical protein DHS20C18_21230 [Saprospiraceae bacterium]